MTPLERQPLIAELLERARTHIESHDFPQARRVLTEIFSLEYDHAEAARLKSTLEAREAEATGARTEKEKLFTVAQRHQRNGELGSALTQLEKLQGLSRNVAGSCIPEREAVFEALYAELRSERDRIAQCCTEADEALAEKNFEKAVAICDGLQASYPNNQEFQALRLKALQAQRQQLLVYVGEVARSVEAEPNLDGRVFLLQDAAKRYPNEELLARQLSLACEQRDLAALIVAKARACEVDGRFAEAIDQWKAVRGIHPLYPGLAGEIEQLEERRAQKAGEEQRVRMISEIERTLGSSAYSDAERLSREALREFPEHPRLLALLGMAQQGFEKCREAAGLLEQAKTVRASGDATGAMRLLRQALDLEPRNVVARNTLVHLLLERAGALLGSDPSAAELLAAEAGRLDPEHSSVEKILKLGAKAKRKKPRLLAAGSVEADGQQTEGSARRELIRVMQPTKLFVDDDSPESSRAAHRTVRQAAGSSGGPAIASQFREIRSVLVYNIKSRVRDSDFAQLILQLSALSRLIPVTTRQIRGFMFALLGTAVALVLLSFAYRYVSRPYVAKPATAPEARIAEAAAPALADASPTAPSYATVAPGGDADSSTSPPPLEPVSGQRGFDSNAGDQTRERPAAAFGSERVATSATPASAQLALDGRSTHPKHANDNSAKAPLPVRFTISSGTPGASVIVDDLKIGELDEKGNFAYAGVTAGHHKIELSKRGYGSRTFYGQEFLPGKSFDLPGVKQLTAAAGYARITVSPRGTFVYYKRSGESAKHTVSDLDRAVALPPGDYEFSADAPQFASKVVEVKIEADQTASVSFDLKPSAGNVGGQNAGFVNPDQKGWPLISRPDR